MMNKTFIVACIAATALSSSIKSLSSLTQSAANLAPHMTNLAQLNNPTCASTSARNKAPLEDFWTILEGTEKYQDKDFTPDKTSLSWPQDEKLDADVSKWTRATQINKKGLSLWGNNDVNPNDIRQGGLGNCWMMSSASALAEKPGRIKRMFLNTENKLNDAGIYAVNLYALGVQHTVIVDDMLPMQNEQQTIFNYISRDGGMWMSILEKAIAKLYGNYKHLDGGNQGAAMYALSGMHTRSLWHKDMTTSAAKDSLWKQMSDADKAGDVIQTGTGNSPGTNGHFDSNAAGIAYGHAYSVIGVASLEDGTKLVQVRNPWGAEGYNGKWSDKVSNQYAEKVRKELDHVAKDDGVYFIEFGDYLTNFEETMISTDNSGWSEAAFVKLGDTSSSSSTPSHTLTVTSDVDQRVWISGNTWEWRGQSKPCWDWGTYHTISAQGQEAEWSYSSPGALKPIDMTAGQSIEVKIDLRFGSAKVPKDWSLTAQGQSGGKITIAHSDGSKSDRLPLITREANAADGQVKPQPKPQDDNDPTPDDPKPEDNTDDNTDPDNNNGDTTGAQTVWERFNQDTQEFEECNEGDEGCECWNVSADNSWTRCDQTTNPDNTDDTTDPDNNDGDDTTGAQTVWERVNEDTGMYEECTEGSEGCECWNVSADNEWTLCDQATYPDTTDDTTDPDNNDGDDSGAQTVWERYNGDTGAFEDCTEGSEGCECWNVSADGDWTLC